MDARSRLSRRAGPIAAFLISAISLFGIADHAQAQRAEEKPTFKASTNLVMVPVIVRDSEGRVVGDLTKDDFQLFDKGKPQEITKFTVERAGGQTMTKAGVEQRPAGAGEEKQPEAAPENFVAYLFDDMHLRFEDLARARDAAGRSVDALESTSRAAIFTTSGQSTLDFTNDRAHLRAALLKMRQHSLTGSGVQECPDITYYLADLIENQHDQQAFHMAVAETVACKNLQGPAASIAPQMVHAAARLALSQGLQEGRTSLIALRDAVRRISVMPGRRIIILTSPGFPVLDELRPDEVDVVDLAIRSNVIVSSLDARGLWTVNPGGEVYEAQYDPEIARVKSVLRQQEAFFNSGVLTEMAAGTGGTLVQNTNDLSGGFRRLATPPEFTYMLGFAPDNLKPDGSFHALKVKLNSTEKLSVQARSGYFAPKGALSEDVATRREIESAVFSKTEVHELPVDLQTQFFKPSDTEAKLKVLVSVDLKQVLLRRDEQRSRNDLTAVSALFDHNGNFVTGAEQVLKMRLLDQTVERLRQGAPYRFVFNFDVKPGNYRIRLVMRDSEGHLMAAENGSVEIP